MDFEFRQALADSVRSAVAKNGLRYQPRMVFLEPKGGAGSQYLFAPDISTSSTSFYLQRWEKSSWKESCLRALKELAREKVHMKGIAVSDQVLNGISLISRAITENDLVVQTGIVLLGSSGVGRKTMLNVAAKLCGYDLISPKTTFGNRRLCI